MRPFLSVCMIVKNEEKVLKRCLESITGIADEIIIVDTGSVDKTRQIALNYTDKVYDFNWIDDFSKARNYAASKAEGVWIFAIDADEYVDRESFVAFRKDLMENPTDLNIIAVKIVNFVGTNGQSTSMNYHERLYKNDGTISYYRNVHELLRHQNSLERSGFSDFQLYHSGYMEETVKEKGKSSRNLSLLLKKPEKEPIDYYFIGNEYDQSGELEKAINYYKKGFELKDDIFRDWVIKMLLRLIDCLHKTKKDREAIELIDSCEGIYTRLVDFTFYKGKIYFDQGDFKKASSIFEDILQRNSQLRADTSPDFLEYLPHKYLGEIYEEERQLHSAVRHYTKALSINDTDNYLWMRLINLLAKHSGLEELVEFLNQNVLNKESMTPQRVITILLTVPNSNVQKLTRSFLDEGRLTNLEKESLLLKNLHLDGDIFEISSLIEKKEDRDVTAILSKGIFNIIDFIIVTMQTNNDRYKNIICEIKFDKPIQNLLNVLLKSKNKKISTFEQDLFLLLYKQAMVIKDFKVLEKLDSKTHFLGQENRNKIKKYKVNYL